MLTAHPTPPRREHLQALLLALFCGLLFLREGLLPGRSLLPYPPEQMDLHRVEAIAADRFDAAEARRGLGSGGDKYLQSLCWDRVLQTRLRQGELPLWTRDIGGGAPFVPQMAQVYEPINLLLLLWPAEQWYGIWYLLHQVLFGYLAWRFLRRLGCLHASALLGLVAAVLGLWTQCKLHHNVILTAALPLWPMLSAVHDLATSTTAAAQRRAMARLGIWTGLSWLSGFAVVSLQASYLTAGFALLCGWQLGDGQLHGGQRRRYAAACVGGLLLGGLLSFAHMIPVLQAAAVSARDSGWNPAFLRAHGLEWDHLLLAWWPDLLSWPADVFYEDPGQPLVDRTRMPWSQLVCLAEPLSPATGAPFQSWVETSFAIGTAPMALAALAFCNRQQRAVAGYFAAVAAVAALLALADQPLLAVIRYLPGLAAADLRRLLFSVAMALVVLAALGATAWQRNAPRWPATSLLGLVAIASALLLWWCHGDFALATARLLACDSSHEFVQQCQGDPATLANAIRGVMLPGEEAANQDRVLATGWRSLLVAVLALLLLLGPWPRWRWPALLLLTIGELLLTGAGSYVALPAERISTPPQTVAPLLQATAANGVRPRLHRLVAAGEARLSACYPSNLAGFHGIEDAGAYNPLPPLRYEDFFLAIEPDRPGKVSAVLHGAGVIAFHDEASLQHPLCDLFGIRYVLTREPVPTSITLLDRTPTGVGDFRLLERTTVLPRATFVRNIDLVPDPTARLALLRDAGRDVANRTVLEDRSAVKPSPREVPPAEVSIVEHSDERVVVRVRCEADGYLRLADPYDAGWRATVNDYVAPVLIADHYLRAVYLRAGEHEVVFTYDDARLRWPRHVSLLTLFGLLWLLLGRRGGSS